MSQVCCTVCEKEYAEDHIEVNGYRSVAKGVLLPYAICKSCLSIMDGEIVNYQKSQEKRQAMLVDIDEKLRATYKKQVKADKESKAKNKVSKKKPVESVA